MKLLLANIPTMICLSIAGILAIFGLDGWGWFLFIGILLSHYSEGRNNSKNQE